MALTLGAALMVMLVLETLLLPSLVVVTNTELFLTPAVVPLTLTLKTRTAPGASEAPDRLIVPEPAMSVTVPPPVVPLNPFGVATTRPAGSESVKAMPFRVIGLAAGLAITKYSGVE